MKLNTNDFRVQEDQKIDLRNWPTSVEPLYRSKEHCQQLLAKEVGQLSAQQQLFTPQTAMPSC